LREQFQFDLCDSTHGMPGSNAALGLGHHRFT